MPNKLLMLALCCILNACSSVQIDQDASGSMNALADCDPAGEKIDENAEEDYPDDTQSTYTEYGEASFYADSLQNRKTANGDAYQHHLKTAAHQSLPLGSTAKVTNIDTGKSVIVQINDRGTFQGGRIIDLSKSAFSQIAETSSGIIVVKVEVELH